MKKKVKLCLYFALFLASAFPFLTISASAEGNESDELLNEYSTLRGEDEKITHEKSISHLGLDSLLFEVETTVGREKGRIGSFFLLLLGISVLMSLSSLVTNELSRTARAATSFTASLLIFSHIVPIIREISSSISVISGFLSFLAITS